MLSLYPCASIFQKTISYQKHAIFQNKSTWYVSAHGIMDKSLVNSVKPCLLRQG